MRLFLVLLASCCLVAANTRVGRSDPNPWFRDLILADQEAGVHDHSGETVRVEQEFCCHRLEFTQDPLTGEDLLHTVVPYNHFWAPGDVLLAVTATLDEPTPRQLSLGDNGVVLDFRAHSQLYVRLQCAYACCLELAEIVRPLGSVQPTLEAGVMGASTPAVSGRHLPPWAPPGYTVLGSRSYNEQQDDFVWLKPGSEQERASSLLVCDYNTTGIWVSVTSPSRVEMALGELDLCFKNHVLYRSWEHSMCEEPENF